MSALQIETLNRFPLRGPHLQLLAAAAPTIRVRDAPFHGSTARRLVSELVQMGLLRREGRGRYAIQDPDLQQTAAAALHERSDLTTLLAEASALQVLAALPTGPGPDRHRCAAISRPTWRRRLDALHRANVVSRRGRLAWINEELQSVGRLVESYRRLSTTWDHRWERSAAALPLPIHQCGIEAAWRVQDAPLEGLVRCDWQHRFFRPLAPVHAVAFHGSRRLDLLDQTLLLVRAEADLRYDLRLDDPTRVDPRISGLVAAGCTPDLLADPDFEGRFAFYGLDALHGHLRRVLARQDGPIWQFRSRYLKEFGVQEGSLG